ncbi:B3 DNA-binding domain protein, partial [Trifolium medium]|nr:B3 DNA-binding domain protein [Trifolium medium]
NQAACSSKGKATASVPFAPASTNSVPRVRPSAYRTTPILISSDSDGEDESDVEDNPNEFEHFPNHTSKNALRKGQKRIFLRDLPTMRVFPCSVLTSNRYVHEKYLGKGWYYYKNEKGLNVGDVMQCTIEDPPRYMNVRVIRHRRGRR